MPDKYPFLSPRHAVWLLLLLLIGFGIYCFVKPLVLSIDSVYGFLAYKGSLFFHSFNVVQEISTGNIGRVNPVFESWWSPGQWLFPALLNYVFGIRLGVAAILVTLAALASGFAGYYRVFEFYRFPRGIILLSLLVIFSSATLYYSFIIYQGGEVLEFGLFPWFLFYVIKIRKVGWRNLMAVTFLFLLCFLAKTTLLLYCTLVLLAKWLLMNKSSLRERFRFSAGSLCILLPALFYLPLISIFFLTRGPRPVLIDHFGISPEAVLVPLSSPLSSILSIQQYIKRGEVIFAEFFPAGANVVVFSSVLYLLVIAILVWFLLCIIRNKKIDASYKILFFILYLGLLAFFLFAYSFNANIDLSSRHFKLMGYLLVPCFFAVLQEKVGASLIHGVVFFFCLLSVLDISYLKEKWTKDRYISVNYFYRNCDPPGTPDKLDKVSYQRLLAIDHEVQTVKGDPAVFYVESTADIAIDLHHPVILQIPGENIRARIYRKNGPRLFVCISKSTWLNNAGILRWKFPGYGNFEVMGETDRYRYFLGSIKNEPEAGIRP